MRVIGIAASGRGVGKSTVACALHRELSVAGYKPEIISVADTLRKTVTRFAKRLCWPLGTDSLYGGKDRPVAETGGAAAWGPITGRDLLVAFGEACVDTMGPDVWASLWSLRAEGFLKSNGNRAVVICDDVRRPEEADAVRALGGVVVYLVGASPCGVVVPLLEGLINPGCCDTVIAYRKTPQSLKQAVDKVMSYFPDVEQ